jgi:hypothetical protein
VTLGPGYFYNQISSGGKHLVESFDTIVDKTAFNTGGASTFCGKKREDTVELVEDSSIQYGIKV